MRILFFVDLVEIYTNMCLFFNRNENLQIYRGWKKSDQNYTE